MESGCRILLKYQIFFMFALSIIANVTNAEPAAMEVKYVDRGVLDARHSYKFDLIKHILEATKAEFGSYIIAPYASDPGARRQSLLISQGDQVNLLWASPGTAIAKGEVIPIPVDILRGLLGYRVCLIDGSNQYLFKNIVDLKGLQLIRVGQGTGWEDISIYNYNNMATVQAPTLEGLFSMLPYKRFDCLALGADEVLKVYGDNKKDMPQLSVEESMFIYYDYPIYFYVSDKAPKLARRIKIGLEKLKTNGEFDRLFNQYFKRDLELLQLQKRHAICIHTPFITPLKQCNYLEQLKNLEDVIGRQ